MLRTAICLSLITGAAAAAPTTPVYSVVYSFQGGADGVEPEGGLIALNGMLYGTTYGGGNGTGTVFFVNPATGAEKIVHAFGGVGDGEYPAGNLLNVNGTLYGTTSAGGTFNHGTIFSIDPVNGADTVVYSFAGGAGDGGNPLGSLIASGGILYGTTQQGGSSVCGGGCGTVFSFNPATGAETVLYRFQSSPDGAQPQGSLLQLGNLLYGTTKIGGAEAGTIFSLNPKTNKEKIVYSFANAPDGVYPLASLIKSGTSLYTTTTDGGKYNQGAVIAIGAKTGSEQVAASFQGGAKDGQYPSGSLLASGGVLYGTASGGGTGACAFSCGTVFSMQPGGDSETTLYFFQGGTDGGKPAANLVKLGGKLYGTTTQGGGSAHCANGCGTVFAIKP